MSLFSSYLKRNLKKKKIMIFFFLISSLRAEDDELGTVQSILKGKWKAEIARTDSDGNHDETEDENVEVRFASKSYFSSKVMTVGVYPDSSKKSEPFYNGTITWESDGNTALVESDSFSDTVSFSLLTKYEARGTVGNIRYLFEVTDADNAKATITDTDTNEKTEITLTKDYPFFDTSVDWKITSVSIVFFAFFFYIVCFCKSEEGIELEKKEIEEYEKKKEQNKAKKEKKRQEEMERRQHLDETL